MKHKLSLAAITLASSISLPVYSQQPEADIRGKSVSDFCEKVYEYCENEAYASTKYLRNLEDKVQQAGYKTESPQNLKELVDYERPRMLDDRLNSTLLAVLGLLGLYLLIDEAIKRRKSGKSRDDNQ